MGGTISVARAKRMISAIKNEPTTLTMNVPYGNGGPRVPAAQVLTRYRTPEPRAPPTQTQRN